MKYRLKTTEFDHVEKCMLDAIIMCQAFGDGGARFYLGLVLLRLEPNQLTFEQLLKLHPSEFIDLCNECVQSFYDTEGQSQGLTPDELAKLEKIKW